jgi:hypothetical protein
MDVFSVCIKRKNLDLGHIKWTKSINFSDLGNPQRIQREEKRKVVFHVQNYERF